MTALKMSMLVISFLFGGSRLPLPHRMLEMVPAVAINLVRASMCPSITCHSPIFTQIPKQPKKTDTMPLSIIVSNG
eukprot:5516820-Amphidinium_carterae.1